jgi:succinate dehydrogenase/fumarate reductase flavoprotein subunit
MGGEVDLFSIVPVKRSHSVCAQGGINAAKNLKGEGDSTWIHFDDTIYGGDFLANQPPVKAMCEAAPGIIDLLDRMGVPFNRTPEGLLDFRRFGGTLYNRTAFAGATTGQQLLYAGARRNARLPRHLRHGPVDDGGADLPGRRHHHCYGRLWRYFRQVHQLGGVHRIGAVGALSAGLLLRER